MKDLYLRFRRKVAYAVLVRKFARSAVPDGAVVFLGDSITAQGSWADWFPGRGVVVRGIGGDTAKGVLARADQVGRPSKLFLMVGTNDVVDETPTAEVVEAVQATLWRVQAQSGPMQVFIQSVTPRTAALAAPIRALNEGLAQLAKDMDATYVELFDLLCDESGALRPGFSVDDLHLEAPAYDIWREAVRPLVED